MKYNNSKKYNSLKTLYKDTKEYNYTVDLFKNHGVPEKYIPQTLNKFVGIKLNDKLEYESIKLVDVYYDENYYETWLAKFDLGICGLEIKVDNIKSIEILD